MATLTGKRWPVVGKRLHEEYPYLEAEVSILIVYITPGPSCSKHR